MAISGSMPDHFGVSGSSSDPQEPSWISSSPEVKIEQLFSYVRAKDKLAYTHMTDNQLREHLRFSIYTAQVLVRIDDETNELTGLATWTIRPDHQVVFLVGILGDKDFLHYMIREWQNQYPFYDLMYFRKGRAVRRKNTNILHLN